jgi:hypothetical protein
MKGKRQELRGKKERAQELEEEDGSKGEQCKMLTTPDPGCV